VPRSAIYLRLRVPYVSHRTFILFAKSRGPALCTPRAAQLLQSRERLLAYSGVRYGLQGIRSRRGPGEMGARFEQGAGRKAGGSYSRNRFLADFGSANAIVVNVAALLRERPTQYRCQFPGRVPCSEMFLQPSERIDKVRPSHYALVCSLIRRCHVGSALLLPSGRGSYRRSRNS